MKKQNLVLLPGYDGNSKVTFAELSNMLTTQYQCFQINYPCLHQTDRAYTHDELIEHIYRQVTKLRLNNFDLLGFSLGGIIGTGFLNQHRKLVKTFILISSSPTLQASLFYRFPIYCSHFAFKAPILAKLFTYIYRSPRLTWITSKLPLPAPAPDFPIDQGYPLFSTLANVLYSNFHLPVLKQLSQVPIPKYSLLFHDDKFFPANTYLPLQSQLGFKVQTSQHGGHANSNDYWQQVAEFIKKELQYPYV